MPPHPLTDFEIQKYYRNEPRFNGVYSRGNLPEKRKDEAYIIKLHNDFEFYELNNNVTYFDSY